MSSLEQIGQKIKAARESRGLTLGQIYDKTKIPTSNLEAIETGDFEQLPEPVYVAGFIKRYADCVGLNGQSLSEEYKHHIEESNDNGRPMFGGFVKSKSTAVQSQPIASPQLTNRKAMEPPRPGLMKTIFWPSMLIILVLVGMGYVMMYQQHLYDQAHDPAVLALKESASKFNSVQPSNPTTTTLNANNPPTTTTDASGEKDCRISLQASQHVWVEVKSSLTGESKFTGFLEAGDRRDFQDEQGLKVTAGNGGSINVSYRGKHETFGVNGQKATREFTSGNPVATGATDGTATATTTDTTVKPVSTVIKKPKKIEKKKEQPAAHRLDVAPSRYIPGESLGGGRSIGVPYRYTDGRLDSD